MSENLLAVCALTSESFQLHTKSHYYGLISLIFSLGNICSAVLWFGGVLQNILHRVHVTTVYYMHLAVVLFSA